MWFLSLFVAAFAKISDDTIRWRQQELNLMKALAEKLKKCDCREDGDSINYNLYR